MIDTHCHLTFPDFAGRTAGVLELARIHDVTGCITISTTTRDCLDCLALAKAFPRIWCTSGIHPLHSDEEPHEWANLRRCIEEPKCVAWGELGLDNHYKTPLREIQHEVLAQHLAFIESALAEGISKPIVIHCREAFDDLIPILRRTKLDPTRFVFHCFTGTAGDCRKVLDFGACISFTGVSTYRNADEVRDAARLVPADRILVETDAPFLSPEPKRGARPCEPWMTSLTAKRLAETRNVDWESFHTQLNANTKRFFGIE